MSYKQTQFCTYETNMFLNDLLQHGWYNKNTMYMQRDDLSKDKVDYT